MQGATLTEAARDFVRSLPSHPLSEGDEDRLAAHLAQLIFGYVQLGCEYGLNQARDLYLHTHENQCRVWEGATCRCFVCRLNKIACAATDTAE